MEHLIREMKTAIKGHGANKLQKAVLLTVKAIGALADTISKFDNNNRICMDRGAHAIWSAKKT